jgi:hypothetical protein
MAAVNAVKAEPVAASPVLGANKVKQEDPSSSSSDDTDQSNKIKKASGQKKKKTEEDGEAIPEKEDPISSDDSEDAASHAEEMAEADELAAMEAKAKRVSVRQDDREVELSQILPDRMRKRNREIVLQRIREEELIKRETEPEDEEDVVYAPEQAEESTSSSASHASSVYKQEEESEKADEASEEESAASSSSSSVKSHKKETVKKPRVEADRLADSVRDVLGNTVRKATQEASKAAASAPKPTKATSAPKTTKPTPTKPPKPPAAAAAVATPPGPLSKSREELEKLLLLGVRLVAQHELTAKSAVSYLKKLFQQAATSDKGQEAQDREAFWFCFWRDKREAYRMSKSNVLDQLAHAYLQRLRETSDNQVLRDLVEVALQPNSQLDKKSLPAESDVKCQLDRSSPAKFQLQLKGTYPQSDKDFCSEPQVSHVACMRLQCVYFAAHVCERFKAAVGDYLEKELELPRDTTDLAHLEGFLQSKQADRFCKQWLSTYQDLLDA